MGEYGWNMVVDFTRNLGDMGVFAGFFLEIGEAPC